MKLMIPTLYERFKKLPSRFYEKGQVVRTKNLHKYKLCKIMGPDLDNLGTQRVMIDGIEGNLLNDMGETFHALERRSFPKDSFPIFTPCIIRNDFIVEVADFIYRPYFGLEMVNHKVGQIPEELQSFGIDVYRGKWCYFYFERYLSLRLILGDSDDFWEQNHSIFINSVPRSVQHVESEKWISKPRVKIWVKKICEQ